LSWNSDNYDQYAATAQTGAGTLTINADSGNPVNGRKILFRFTGVTSPQNLFWTSGVTKSFREVGVTLPLTTVVNKTIYVGCIYNEATVSTDARWDVVAVSQEV
jgi:hypothetical protein